MGHIANKIDAKDKKLSEVLNGQRYRIDSFQREYRWQRLHIESLISDLSQSFLKNHKEGDTIEDYSEYDCYYMGPIVLCQEKTELSIVDGQQRLTSFTLLLIYLHHAQKKIGLADNFIKDLKPYLYVNKVGKTTLVLNVETRNSVINHLIENPDTIFQREDSLVEAKGSSSSNIPDESIVNILRRYEDIGTIFPSEINNVDVLPIFIEWLLEKVVMVEVKAYSMENAYTIFETMNDRGLTLNPSEILKGYLLSKITDDTKSDEANEFWRRRIVEIKTITASDNSDMEFFRAWLRAKYAITKRKSGRDSENEDFEIIGTNFHTWIKNNNDKTFLRKSDDYYFFIQSDFNFYSNLYLKLFKIKNGIDKSFNQIYISSFYPIADSLFYPLLMSPISKIEDEKTINKKIELVGNFIDVYITRRTLANKSISQTGIRNSIYELVKNIRDANYDDIKNILGNSLEHIDLPYLFAMNNWGYFHYFYSRIIYSFDDSEDFRELQRNRRQRSYILVKIFNENDMPEDFDEINWQSIINSAANFCLIRRYDYEEVFRRNKIRRIKYIIKQKYLPEMSDYEVNEDWTIADFIGNRDLQLRRLIDKIWNFDL